MEKNQVKKLTLTEAEWQIMECLWESAPLTGREVTERMEKRTGWSRSTSLTMLRRLGEKGAIGEAEGDGKKAFLPLISRDDAALRETEDLLSRAYHGSVSLLLSAFTKKQRLSREEIDEMYALLAELENKNEEETENA